MPASRVSIAGVSFDAVTFAEAVDTIDRFLAAKNSGEKFHLVTPNPEICMAAQTDAAFREILNEADLSVADGTGIVWASYFLSFAHKNIFTLVYSLLATLLRRPQVFAILPERVTGVDLFPEILKIAARRGEKVFLLGAAPGVAERVREKFTAEIPDLQIVGVHAGSPSSRDDLSARMRIARSRATLLVVAYGAPAQEQWIARNLPKMKNIRFAAGLGGTFDFYAGEVSRAPRFFQRLGLEWVWRLIRQPERHDRIVTAAFRFPRMIFRG